MAEITKFIRFKANILILSGVLFITSFELGFPLEIVQTTGRAVIQSIETKDEARMQALEEALYLAALRGGAKIDGFSTVETNSAISENFVIRPTNGIIDYTIIREEQIEEHYSVTVLAAVGEIETVGCKIGSIINLTAYKPLLQVEANSPAWLQAKIRNIYSMLVSELENSSDFNVKRVENEVLDIDKLKSTDDNFDYAALTTGRTRINAGSYALRTEIIISSAKSFEMDLIKSTSDNLTMRFKSSVFQGGDYNPIFTQKDQIDVLLNQSGASRIVNIMASPSRDSVFSNLKRLVPIHVEKVKSKLKCQPLTATLNVEGGRLRVEIGEAHGVKFSSLAIIEEGSAQWTLLRVVELGNNYAILETFDKADDLTVMKGLEIKFLQET